MERSALRKLLLAAGEGDPDRIEEVLKAPIVRAVSAEEVAVSEGLVSEWRLCELQAGHYNLPLQHVEPKRMDAGLVGMVSLELARMHCVIPVGKEDGVLILAMADPADTTVVNAIQWATKLKVRRSMAARSEINRALDYYASLPRIVEPQAPPPGLKSGAVLQGRYCIDRIIGQGGMGNVYLATEEVLGGKKLAIKEMMVSIADPKERQAAIEQFQREARILATLDHPGLVDVTHYFEQNSKQYLVMAYIDGKTLETIVQETPGFLAIPRVLSWMDQVCDVLEYLHALSPPVIFRDMKPSNVMLDARDRIRLIDFGISRVFDSSTTVELLKGAGTEGFAPLEQYTRNDTTDHRTDIYGAGATLYSILTRTVPPPAVDLVAGCAQVIPPSQINPAVGKPLEAVVMTMMALRKEDRFQKMAAARRALRHARSTMSPDAEVPGAVHILVVDDDMITRTMIESALDKLYTVTLAEDGAAALELAVSNRPDLIISDIEMPGLDGVTLVYKLRSLPETKDIPIILLTGHTDVAQEAHGLEAGADDYVTKPVDPQRLLVRVRAVLRRSLRRSPA